MAEKTLTVKRRIGIVSGISLILGNIIGSGIFISPKGVFQGTGSVGLCLVIWTFCGFIAIAGSFVYIDLGLLVQRSGADYAYFTEVIGTFPAFLYTWVQILVVYPMSHVIKTMTVAEYLSVLVITGDCGQKELIKRLMAAMIIVSITIMNVISVRAVARTQIILMIIKVGALLVIITGGIISMVKGRTEYLDTGFEGTTDDISDVASAMYSGIWAYGGWLTLNFSLEEVSNPRRTLPISILTSVILVLFLYVMVNVSYFSVLSKEEFLSSWAVGVSWEQKVLGSGSFFIPLVVVLSVFGSSHGTSFSSARIAYAAARDGTFPEVLSYINVKTKIPSASVLLVSSLALVYLALPGDIGDIINYAGFIGSGFFALTFICHIVLSIKSKQVNRPIKVNMIYSIRCQFHLLLRVLINLS